MTRVQKICLERQGRQSERKDVVGTGCIRAEMGKMYYGETERREAWKRHMEKVMNEENEWDGEVEIDIVQGPIDKQGN